MIIEGLGKVSFANGLLKVQTLSVDAGGELRESGQLEIPGSKVGEIISSLGQAATSIEEKVKEASSDNTSNKKEDKSSKKKKK